MIKLKTFIFIGPSGCGKGTQAELLIKYLTEVGDISTEHPILHSESGQRFRDFIQETNFVAQETKMTMGLGARLPDALAVWNWAGYLIKNYTGKEHLIFDGSPRSLLEAKVLDTMLAFLKRGQAIVIFLDVSSQESTKRLLKRAIEQGRADDNSEDIKRRLDWFEKDVRPALEYYEKESTHLFLHINGEQSREKIHEDIKIKIMEFVGGYD
ncbi:MAG: nucleoside monophosphate kinase [Candidatus Paceibacterota bacterium]|jgi:adenylate kinase